jgi:hypothetical protein
MDEQYRASPKSCSRVLARPWTVRGYHAFVVNIFWQNAGTTRLFGNGRAARNTRKYHGSWRGTRAAELRATRHAQKREHLNEGQSHDDVP